MPFKKSKQTTYQYLSLLRETPLQYFHILISRPTIVNRQVELINKIITDNLKTNKEKETHHNNYLGKAMNVPLFRRVTSLIKVANRPVE